MDLSVRTETFGADDQSWLGSARGTSSARSITLDVSAFTAATHYPSGFFTSGIGLAVDSSSGKFVPYNSAGTGDPATLAGFLLSPVKAPAATTTDVVAALLDHGRIVLDRLPVADQVASTATTTGEFVFV